MQESSYQLNTSIVNHSETTPAIFYLDADEYLYPEAGVTDPLGQNCFLPIEVDTEFYHPPITLPQPSPDHLSPTLTVQCRATALEVGTIFTHLDSAAYARHPLATSDFIIVDYLRSLGYQVSLEQTGDYNDDIAILQVDLYACFAVAEVMRIVRNDCALDIRTLCLDAEHRGYGITQGRRLRTFTRCQGQYLPWVDTKWLLSLNGIKYGVRLCWYDTSAVHGVAGYAGLCQNTGVSIPYKDNFTPAEKADMLRMYLERPEDFDNYALGDLYNHKALVNNTELFACIYDSIALEPYYRIPRLTTGATVRDLIEARVAHMFYPIHPDKNPREIVNAYCKAGTADEVKKRTSTTAAYNAKVDGGRCRNNRPTDTTGKGTIVDLDISGCYGEGLRVQLYPVGIPVIIDYPLESARNSYLTLREFIKKYGKEFVSGLWQARVSTLEGYRLKYPQDFLTSWFPPKDVAKLATDSEFEETNEWWGVDNVGLLKILTHQVNLAIINHDFIQWLDNVASSRQRKELLDNLHVVTAMYYPASERVATIEELRHRHDTHDGRNTCTIRKVRGKTTKISVEQECHAWYAETMGDMFITKLLQERAKHAKKTPLNELYKLCVNTSFGDMVSPYFTVGNVVVGNNITARARSLAWYMEKGLHGWQTITDGCAFDANRVLYPKQGRRVNGETVVGLYRDTSRNLTVEFKPLSGYATIAVQAHNTNDGLKPELILSNTCKQVSNPCLSVYNTCNTVSDNCLETLRCEESKKWLGRAALAHLKHLFPGVDVLHQATTDIEGAPRQGQFAFEVKSIYDMATFHGTANYCFQQFGEIVEIKMRSYSKKAQELLDSNLTVSNSEYYPAKQFLASLINRPTSVARHSPYLKANILKVGDYSRHYVHRYEDSKVLPGMTVKGVSVLREFSLAQFTYQDIEQYRAWERESDGLRKRYGQSYEMFFLNPDSTLNYQVMVETIDNLIATGKKGFWDGHDKRSKHGYRTQSKHPALDTLEAGRQALQNYYGYKNATSYDEDELESDEEVG